MPVEPEWRHHQVDLLATQDGWKEYAKRAKQLAAEDRAAKRAMPLKQRLSNAVTKVGRSIKFFFLVAFYLAAGIAGLAVGALGSVWIYDRATTDYGLLGGILIGIPFWWALWVVLSALWAALMDP